MLHPGCSWGRTKATRVPTAMDHGRTQSSISQGRIPGPVLWRMKTYLPQPAYHRKLRQALVVSAVDGCRTRGGGAKRDGTGIKVPVSHLSSIHSSGPEGPILVSVHLSSLPCHTHRTNHSFRGTLGTWGYWTHNRPKTPPHHHPERHPAAVAHVSQWSQLLGPRQNGIKLILEEADILSG